MTLCMLVVVGLASASALRGATSAERLADNIRLESLAQQYAEMALRYCEAQMQQPPARWIPGLQGVDRQAPVAPAAARWRLPATWAPVSQAVQVPALQVASAQDSTFRPNRAPECLAEKVALAGGGWAYLVTSRGFSPDWRGDPGTGATRTGSMVWLQSTLVIQ